MRSILLSAVFVIVVAEPFATDVARASALAFDSAADPAYAPYVTTGAPIIGVNGGYGWEPWVEMYSDSGVLSVSSNPHLLALSTNGSSWSQSPVTSPGTTWILPGMFDSPIATLEVRHFDGSLAVGQTLSFDVKGVPTIGILSSDGTGLAYEVDPGNPYRVSFDHTGISLISTGVPYTNEGGHISITPIDPDHVILSVTSYGPGGGTASIEMPYVDVDGVAFEAPWGDLSGYVNNLSITPEPCSAALIAAVGLGLLLRRSRGS